MSLPTWMTQRYTVPSRTFRQIDGDLDKCSRPTIKMYTLYVWQLTSFFKIAAVYIFDLATLVIMINTNDWSNDLYNSCKDETDGLLRECGPVPFRYARWIFLGCLILSSMFLAVDCYKAMTIVRKGLVCESYTNNMAYWFRSSCSFARFCFFHEIEERLPAEYSIAFFCLHHWRTRYHVLLADGPRQILNIWTLYLFYRSRQGFGPIYDWETFTDGNIKLTMQIVTTLASVILYAWSAVTFLLALVSYPWIFYFQMRGNLKGFCHTKVDVYVSDVIKEFGIKVENQSEEHEGIILSFT